MSKPPPRPKGRPATDERGNSTWKWDGEGEARVETALIRALGEGLSLEPPPQNVDLDPYSQSTSPGKETTKGRSLDDMRRLNEEMKREHEALVKSLRKRTSRKAESARGMRLRFDDREVLVGERHPSVSVGRGEDKDIVVTGERVSLMHARIEFSGNKFVLIDQSTNGTYVQSADGKESFIRRGSSQLTGQGMIGLGARPRQGSTHTIGFTCEDV